MDAGAPDPAALQEVIFHILTHELRLEATEIGPESELFSAGWIDSVDLVRLAAHLERRFGIAIPDEDVSVEQFDSIRSIAAYVAEKLRA